MCPEQVHWRNSTLLLTLGRRGEERRSQGGVRPLSNGPETMTIVLARNPSDMLRRHTSLVCHGIAVAPHRPETGPTLEGARRRRSSREPPTRMHFALSMTKDRSCHPPELTGMLKTRSVSHSEAKMCQRFMWPPRCAQVAGCRGRLFCCKCKGERCRQNSAVCGGNKLVALGTSFS